MLGKVAEFVRWSGGSRSPSKTSSSLVERHGHPEEAFFTLAFSPVPDARGSIGGVLVTVSETAEQVRARKVGDRRQRAEEALRESEERLRIALEAADLGTWDLDLTSDTASVRSLRHDQIFGYEEPQSEWGQEIAMRHVLPEDRPTFRQAFTRAVETGVLSFKVRVQRPDGSIRWITPLGRTYYDAEGRPVRIAGVVADITESKHSAEASERARVAERASEAKSQFLAVMSHELRTPLTGIIGYADLLESEIFGSVTAKQHEALARIKASSWHLVSIIDEILTLSRAEAGKEAVRAEEADVAEIASEVVGSLESEAARRAWMWISGTASVDRLSCGPIRARCGRSCSTWWATRFGTRGREKSRSSWTTPCPSTSRFTCAIRGQESRLRIRSASLGEGSTFTLVLSKRKGEEGSTHSPNTS